MFAVTHNDAGLRWNQSLAAGCKECNLEKISDDACVACRKSQVRRQAAFMCSNFGPEPVRAHRVCRQLRRQPGIQEEHGGGFRGRTGRTSTGRWRAPERTGRQCAEVCFVPNSISTTKKGRHYRYLAIREVLRQAVLPGMDGQRELPFQTLNLNRLEYKIFGLVRNLGWRRTG